MYKKLSKADLKDNDGIYKGCVMLEPREWLDAALMGKDAKTGGAIYDKMKIVEIFAQKDNLSFEDALDMVDYNTERAIPYMPNPKPILQDMFIFEDEETSDED